VGSGEPGWPVCGEQATGRRRAEREGKNKKTSGIHKLRLDSHLMFLSFLTWPRNINRYVPRGSDVAEKHKDSLYILRPDRCT
jgi:hypothetical protein